MAYENGALDATLAAAAGDDPIILAELRHAFVESIRQQVDLLRRSRCDGNWNIAALRLKGLAASFHAEGLIGLAENALAAAPGEPVVIRKLEEYLRKLDTAGY